MTAAPNRSKSISELQADYSNARAEEAAARDRKHEAQRAIEAHLFEASGMEGKVIFDQYHRYGVLVDGVNVYSGCDYIAGFHGFALKKDGTPSKTRRLIYSDKVLRVEEYPTQKKGGDA